MSNLDMARVGFRYMQPDGSLHYVEADGRGIVNEVVFEPIPGVSYLDISRMNADFFGEFLVSAIRQGELD